MATSLKTQRFLKSHRRCLTEYQAKFDNCKLRLNNQTLGIQRNYGRKYEQHKASI